MPASDRIECRGCGRAVVPQLMADDRNKLHRPRVTHLCPFCGAVIHESGGGRDRGMLALIVGFSCLSLLLILLLVFTTRF